MKNIHDEALNIHSTSGKVPEFYSLEESLNRQDHSRQRRFRSGIVYVAFLFSAIMFILILLSCKSPDISFNNERVTSYNGEWQINKGKETFNQTVLPFQTNVPAMETVTYKTVLPGKESAEGGIYNSIMFRSMHQYVRVYLEKELLYEFGYDQSTLFSDAPGNGWLIVRLPGEFEGKTLTIEKRGYYDNYAGGLQSLFLGTKNALVFYVQNACMPVIFINLCIILLSVCLLISSFYFKMKETVHQLRYLSLFALVTSTWLLLESGGYQLFAGRPPIITNAIFILFSLIPLVFIRFIMTYEYFRESNYMSLVFKLSAAGFLIIQLLQVTGVCNYFKSITITHILILLVVGGILQKYLAIRIKRLQMKESYLFFSCFVFAGFGMVDLIRFYMVRSIQSTLFSQIGWFFYFMILCYFAIVKIVIDNENSINKMYYEKMAYSDILTGLPNRNAFEQEMEYYRKNRELYPTVLVADLNRLKMINDTFGHGKGDAAIIQVGSLLTECFGASSHIFRIGGDEFCAIFPDMESEELKEQIKVLLKKAEDRSRQLSIPVSVATGYCKAVKEYGIDRTFNMADSDMYENKRKMKSKE